MSPSSENRRKFLRESLKRLVRTGMDISGTEIKPEPPLKPKLSALKSESPLWLNKQPNMTYSRLGRTNLMMSRLALGCAEVQFHNVELVHAALERGVNWLDTARNFGESEAAIGSILDSVRGRAWVCTKTPPIDFSVTRRFSPDEEAERNAAFARFFEQSLESSLARLRGEMIDCYMLQSVEKPETAQNRVLADALARAKEQGKIRHAGLSTIRNVREVALAAIRSGVFDVVMLPLHPMNLSSMLPLIDEARFKDVGVIGMMSAIALEGHPSVALHELPPGLNAYQLTYMYMLRHTAHAGSVAQMDAMEQLEQNLPVPGIEIGINAGNELDAVVYDELWPPCSVCNAKRAFGEDRLELAYQMRYHAYDLSRLGGEKPEGNWRICENCAAATEGSL